MLRKFNLILFNFVLQKSSSQTDKYCKEKLRNKLWGCEGWTRETSTALQLQRNKAIFFYKISISKSRASYIKLNRSKYKY